MGVCASSLTQKGLEKEYNDSQNEKLQQVLAGMTISERNLIFDFENHSKLVQAQNLLEPLNQHISRLKQVQQQDSMNRKSMSEVGMGMRIGKKIDLKKEITKSEGALQVKSSHERNIKLLAECESGPTIRGFFEDSKTNVNETDLCPYSTSDSDFDDVELYRKAKRQVEIEIERNQSSHSNSLLNVLRQRIAVEQLVIEDDKTVSTHIVLKTVVNVPHFGKLKRECITVEYIYQKDLGKDEFTVEGSDFENILPVNEDILEFQSDYENLQHVDYFLTFLDFFMNNFFGLMTWNNFKIDLKNPLGQRLQLVDYDFEPSTLIFSLKDIKELTFLQTAHHFEIIGQTNSQQCPYKKFILEGDNIEKIQVIRGKKFIRINLPSKS